MNSNNNFRVFSEMGEYRFLQEPGNLWRVVSLNYCAGGLQKEKTGKVEIEGGEIKVGEFLRFRVDSEEFSCPKVTEVVQDFEKPHPIWKKQRALIESHAS